MTNEIFKDIMTDQLKEELVQSVSDKIEENIQSIDTTFEGKQEIEISEPKVFTNGEFREREVCKKASGFMAKWLKCSLVLDKWYPERELAPQRLDWQIRVK